MEALDTDKDDIPISINSKFVYHVTEIKFLSSILKKGIIAKGLPFSADYVGRETRYHDRDKEKLVYLVHKSTDVRKAINMFVWGWRKNLSNLAVVVINTKKIAGHTFYKYPQTPGMGIFVKKTIPAKAIEYSYEMTTDKKFIHHMTNFVKVNLAANFGF